MTVSEEIDTNTKKYNHFSKWDVLSRFGNFMLFDS